MTARNTIREIVECRPDTVGDIVESATEPLLLKGLASDWPVVAAARRSQQDVIDYLKRFYSGAQVSAFFAPADIRGRVGYTDDLSGFNYDREILSFDEFVGRLFAHIDEALPPACYMGSTLLDRWFPGFRAENDLALGDRNPLVSLWIGNKIRVSAHFDVPDNVACCVAGRRRFTLFPPEQLDNLYIGPWDVTPAGQAISLVDFDDPDFERFPRFRDALEAAYVVTLEPGDALFLPGMWWHHVAGLDGLNMLVNYWWRATPAFMGTPLSALKHALLSVRGLPPEQRRAWRHIFDYYIFDPGDDAIAHIPQSRRGMLGSLDEVAARRLRADLLNQLNR